MTPVDAILLQCQDKPGPRYTSYPGDAAFHAGFGENDYLRHLSIARNVEAPLSLYTHLPFCAERCLYCAYHNVVTRNMELALGYLERLRREVAMVATQLGTRRQVAQFYWGGGTPTYFSPRTLRGLMSFYREHFVFLPDAEMAVEIDPRVTTEAHLEALSEEGFNRLSLGVQDLDPLVQATVRRVQSVEETAKFVETSRRLGFRSLNIDLIYGLPFQSVSSFRQTVTQVVALKPDRLTIYPFAFVPQLKPHQRMLPEEVLPPGSMTLELLAAAREVLLEAGYLDIGMGQFALEGDELSVAQRQRRLSRNLMGYTASRAPDTLGFGLSAIGYVGGAFIQNVNKLSHYDDAIDGGRLPIARGYVLNEDDRIRQHLIRELICNLFVDKREVEHLFGLDFDRYFKAELAELQDLAVKGLVELSDDAVAASALSRSFIGDVVRVFDRFPREEPTFPPTV